VKANASEPGPCRRGRIRVLRLRAVRRRIRGLRLRAVIRGLWPDRNVVRRRSDRAEAAVMAVLVCVFVASALVVGSVLGVWALLAVPGVGVALSGAALAVHRAMERRRLAAWEADWARTGPRWSRRR
jgi:hypothetical protein